MFYAFAFAFAGIFMAFHFQFSVNRESVLLQANTSISIQMNISDRQVYACNTRFACVSHMFVLCYP